MNDYLKIQIPEGYNLPNYKTKVPQEGEYYLVFDKTGECRVVRCQGNLTKPYHIVHPTWKPPVSCPIGAVFVKDADLGWLVSFKPNKNMVLSSIYTDFTPPPYSPYEVK